MVARADLRERHEDFLVLGLEPYAVHAEGHAAGKILDRLLVRPFLEQLAELEQEHDGVGRAEVAARDGNADRDRVQQFHAHLTMQQAVQAAADERERQPAGADRRQRRGQEQAAAEAGQNFADQLFLILTVERAAAVRRGQRLNGLALIGEAADGVEDSFALAAAVVDDDAAGALMHRGLRHSAAVLKIRFDEVGLLERHTILRQTDAHTPMAFV